MKPLPPNLLVQGRYLIVHLIGKGGMGEVYLAVDQRLGSAVALKRTFFADDEMMANAFEREARILANLRHPILPKVSDHFIDGENQFLVMEHITGDDLAKRLESTGQPFPLTWVLFWADQLLDALNYLHTHDPPIIHRDIKPQNLKLTNDNHIVLLDFGLSKNSLGETRLTSGGSIAGYTPHYAPMEQIRGTGTNAQSDVYSLSATLYQLMTNTVPPDALTRADSLLSDIPDPVKPVSELNAEVTPEVSDTILKGMEIRQENRWESAREMQKSLRDAFAKLQTVMSAQTIAFNVDESDAGLGVGPDEEVETEHRQPAEIIPGIPETDFSTFTGNDIEATSGKVQTPEPEFDETVNFQPGDTDEAAAPSDVKTEVLLAGESPEIEEARENFLIPLEEDSLADDVFGASDESAGTEDFSAGEISGGEFSEAESFSPDATVPLVSFDEPADSASAADAEFDAPDGSGETDFFDIPSEGTEQDAVPVFEPPATAATEGAAESVSQAVPPAQIKKSGGKWLAIVAGVFLLLLVVGVGLAGVVWYLTRDSGSAGVGDASPTPAPTIDATPSPAPTLEVTVVNSNSSGNGNLQGNANSSGDSTIDGTRTQRTPQQTTTRPTPVTPRSTPVVRSTPKPPPKPTPKRPSRTDIEQ